MTLTEPPETEARTEHEAEATDGDASGDDAPVDDDASTADASTADASTEDDGSRGNDGSTEDEEPFVDEHLRDVEPGAGCTEIWEHLSETREE